MTGLLLQLEAGGKTLALGDGELYSLTFDAADNDSDEFQQAQAEVIETFKSKLQRTYLGTAFKVSDATQSDFAVGLIITDTTFIDVNDGNFRQS